MLSNQEFKKLNFWIPTNPISGRQSFANGHLSLWIALVVQNSPPSWRHENADATKTGGHKKHV